MDAKDDGFEKGIKRLHKIVSLLEEGEMPLEKGLALFTEGSALAKSCRKRLESAKALVTMASADGLVPFPNMHPGDGADDDGQATP